jgi:ferritin-like metal-binding protein YciE
METAHELFVHEINDMLDGEKQLIKALGELEKESDRSELKKAFGNHRKQTEEHVRRLEQILDEVDQPPEETECKGIRGLIEEKKTFTKEQDPTPELLNIFNVSAASKVEAYEIRAYNSLIDLATELGLRRATQLLERTLREEQQTLNKLETLSNKLKPKNLGLEEEEDEIVQPGYRRKTA